MKIPQTLLALLAVIAALLVAKQCGYRQGRADERHISEDQRTNKTIARLATEQMQAESRFQRTCADCGHTDEERGAIIEESERTPWRYAKVEPVGDEPDD